MKAEHTADIEALLAQAGWLRRFARALLHNADDAEDLAHDTFATALRQPAAGAGRAWLATVARNLAVDRFRGAVRRSRREEAAQDHDTGRVTTPEELVGDAQIHRHVAEAVANLAEPFRQTLVLRFYQGLSSVEIAQKLREPEGTIRWRVKEGLGRVRRELDRRHGDDRAAWVAALGPLLPKAEAPVPRPLRAARSFPAPMWLAATAMGLSVVVTAIVLFAPKGDGTKDAPTPSSGANVPVPRNTPAVRLNLAGRLAPQTDAVAVLPPGPGRIDAQSLAEELVGAVQANDYEAEKLLLRLIEAVKAESYDAFLADADANMKKQLSRQQFEGLCGLYTKPLKQGYTLGYFGQLKQRGMAVYVWKVAAAGAPDEALVRLWLKDAKVSGVVVQ